MSVEFDEEAKFNNMYNKSLSKPYSGLTKWIIENGLAKDERGAKNIMIIVSIICFSLAIYFALK